MIPTREQIAECILSKSLAGEWLRAMRDEIDRLQAACEPGTDAIKALGELSHAIGNPALEFGRGVTIASALVQFVLDKIRTLGSTEDRLTAENDELRARAEQAEAEARLLQSQLQLAIERTEKLCVKADSAEHWERVAKNARKAMSHMADDLAALKPSEDREAKIKAWEACALAIKDDGDYHPIDVYRITLHEIRNAVALMRSAGDGKVLLRELRARLVGYGYLDLDLPMRTIDEMLAQPAPVEQPAAAVPDDTRELVAQLADFVAILLKGEPNRDAVRAIAAELRGGA